MWWFGKWKVIHEKEKVSKNYFSQNSHPSMNWAQVWPQGKFSEIGRQAHQWLCSKGCYWRDAMRDRCRWGPVLFPFLFSSISSSSSWAWPDHKVQTNHQSLWTQRWRGHTSPWNSSREHLLSSRFQLVLTCQGCWVSSRILHSSLFPQILPQWCKL